MVLVILRLPDPLREDTAMMLLTFNTAANNGHLANNTVMYHYEENAHITD